jgi:hypothetical protein
MEAGIVAWVRGVRPTIAHCARLAIAASATQLDQRTSRVRIRNYRPQLGHRSLRSDRNPLKEVLWFKCGLVVEKVGDELFRRPEASPGGMRVTISTLIGSVIATIVDRPNS